MPASTSLADGRTDGGAPDGGGARQTLLAPLQILRGDPSAIPALGALALLIAWAANQAGYPQTHWAPGGLILLALLAIAVGASGLRVSAIPWPVRIAIGALAAYTAFSFLSILWGNVPGDAWEGADRTLVYLVVFVLFASFRRSGSSAALLLCAWTLAMSGLAVYTVLHVDAAAASASRMQSLMPEGRLIFPTGYVNANAALWMMAFFPAWLLASARRLPSIVRGLLAGGAVVLASVALYSQSRGSVYSTPVVLALVFLLLPGRVRNLVTLIPIVLGAGLCAPSVLHLAKRLEASGTAPSEAHSTTLAVLLAAVAVAVATAVLARIAGGWPAAAGTRRRARKGIAAVALLAALAAVVAGIVAVGRPVGRAEHAWNTFTSVKGYAANSSGQSRLTEGFGSNRYDFYRVAWRQFLDHPLLGIGADNFAQQYLRLGRSPETPRYPHSVELRTLAETGLIGAVFALAGLIAAMVAVTRALGRRDSLGKAVAGAAIAGFGYWVVHGSFDWFFEYAGLGAAAFVLLGLSCSLCPPQPAAHPHGAQSLAEQRGAMRPRLRAAGVAGCLAVLLAAATSLALPWLSRLQVEHAARVWTSSPAAAYAQLEEAASLNPLSAEPNLIAATIALRLEELGRARTQFRLALSRTPENAYATLELGAIASSRGEQERALALLRRAAALNPRSSLVRQTLEAATAGRRVNISDLNRSILREAKQFS